MTRFWVVVAAVAALMSASPEAVTGSTGVRVDLGEVQIDDQLLAGQRYVLPQLGVSNPGTEASSYQMAVMPLQDTVNPPASWVEFDPERFDLEPGETQTVHVALQLPPDADPGDYETLVGAQVVAPNPGSGAGVGAAAASRLTFTISPSSIIQGWLLAAGSFFTKYAPWPYIVLGLVLLGVAVVWFRRRFTFRLERRT